MTPQNQRKTIWAWTFYDWANSVYPLIITAAIFPIYYESVTRHGSSDLVRFLGFELKNTSLYTYSLSFAYLLIALLSPLLSGIADYTGRKKRFMQFFCYLGALSCSAMYFFNADRLYLGIGLIVLACIGYSGSLVFYNAYLPEIASNDQQDRVSARGFAMGYVGSVLLLSFCLTLILKPDWYGGISKGDASRLSFLLVGVWWFVFAQIPFFVLPNSDSNRPWEHHVLSKGYRELKKVWAELRLHPQLTRFLGAFFVYIMGLQTVMLIATLFGKKEIGLESGQLIVTVMILQFVAIIGAYLFAFCSRRIGNIPTLQLATLIWIGVCLAAYFIHTPVQFFMLAGMVGLVMGGTQALSRSTYSKMLPETVDHASYFSFYDVTEKLAIVFGTATFGLLEQLTNSMRTSILLLFGFFVLGFILLRRVSRKPALAVIDGEVLS
ncbi:MAG: MFS transporter [Candidatus Sericytochromatia bacterium]